MVIHSPDAILPISILYKETKILPIALIYRTMMIAKFLIGLNAAKIAAMPVPIVRTPISLRNTLVDLGLAARSVRPTDCRYHSGKNR